MIQKEVKFSINLLWSISLVFFFFFPGGRRHGVVPCADNTACLFQFSVLLSCGFITHPLLLTVLGLGQQIPCYHQPTRWIKNKANFRLLLPFSPLLISPALILKQPSSLLNESLQEDEPGLEVKICNLPIKATWWISHQCHQHVLYRASDPEMPICIAFLL